MSPYQLLAKPCCTPRTGQVGADASAGVDASAAWADLGVGDAQGLHIIQELSFPLEKDLNR